MALKTAFEKGFRRFDMAERTPELENVRKLAEFNGLVNEYKAKNNGKYKKKPVMADVCSITGFYIDKALSAYVVKQLLYCFVGVFCVVEQCYEFASYYHSCGVG